MDTSRESHIPPTDPYLRALVESWSIDGLTLDSFGADFPQILAALNAICVSVKQSTQRIDYDDESIESMRVCYNGFSQHMHCVLALLESFAFNQNAEHAHLMEMAEYREHSGNPSHGAHVHVLEQAEALWPCVRAHVESMCLEHIKAFALNIEIFFKHLREEMENVDQQIYAKNAWKLSEPLAGFIQIQQSKRAPAK